jgi:molecular chaperone GrpE
VAEESSNSTETESDAQESNENSSDVEVGMSYEEQLETRVAELEGEIARVTDGLLRKSADFENYRKRMLREKEEFAAYANRELLLDIVSIIDDFERAIRSADESHDFTAFHDGIVMIEKQFTSMLERKWKLTRFDSVGEEFDPQQHEAMMTEERDDHEQSMVLEDFQKGYLLHEKVLRPAKVKVSMPTDANSSAQK